MSQRTRDLDASLAAELRQHLSLQLGRPLAQVSGNARLIEDLGMDSLELADLLVTLETRYGISLPMEAIRRLDTVESLLREASACLRLPQ